MGRWWLMVLAMGTGLSGCAALSCFGSCGSHTHNSSSLVDFLYPDGQAPPQRDAVPQLRIPLRVGLAFLPSSESDASGGLDAAHQEQLLERIRQRFSSRKFVTEIYTARDDHFDRLGARHARGNHGGIQRRDRPDDRALRCGAGEIRGGCEVGQGGCAGGT